MGLNVEHGRCKAFHTKWYYNSDIGACEVFVYGGCGGNANRFDSYKECRATCMPADSPTEPEVPVTEETTKPPFIEAGKPWYGVNEKNQIPITSTVLPDLSETKAPVQEEVKVEGGEIVEDEVKTQHVTEAATNLRSILGFKSTTVEYILVVVVLVIVAVSVLLLVVVSLVHMTRKMRKADKKEKVLEGLAYQYRERLVGCLSRDQGFPTELHDRGSSRTRLH